MFSGLVAVALILSAADFQPASAVPPPRVDSYDAQERGLQAEIGLPFTVRLWNHPNPDHRWMLSSTDTFEQVGQAVPFEDLRSGGVGFRHGADITVKPARTGLWRLIFLLINHRTKQAVAGIPIVDIMVRVVSAVQGPTTPATPAAPSRDSAAARLESWRGLKRELEASRRVTDYGRVFTYRLSGDACRWQLNEQRRGGGNGDLRVTATIDWTKIEGAAADVSEGYRYDVRLRGAGAMTSALDRDGRAEPVESFTLTLDNAERARRVASLATALDQACRGG